MVLLVTEDCPIVHDYRKIYLDYKTNEKFNVENPAVLARTMRDFSEIFIKPKNEKKYICFIKKLTDTFFCVDVQGDLNSQLDKQQKFVEDMFKSGGFNEADREKIRKEMLGIFNTNEDKIKYDQLTGNTCENLSFNKQQEEKTDSNKPKTENNKVSRSWKDICSIW